MKPTLIVLFVVGFVLITLPLVFFVLLPNFYGFEVDPRIGFWIAVGNIIGTLVLIYASVKLRDERIRLGNERKQSNSPLRSQSVALKASELGHYSLKDKIPKA